jgi:hypothetical protein
MGKDGWKSVKKHFDEVTANDGRLHQETFAKWIGTYTILML